MVNMKNNYVIWTEKNEPNACLLEQLTGLDSAWRLRKGHPLATSFPKTVSFRMNPDFPHDTVLTDALLNINMAIVASPRLVSFLQQRGLEKVEYLPVTILNHKRKVVSTDYSIVHPIDPPDCLDIPKCKVKWSSLDKESIDEMKKLVLDEAKLSASRELFRPKSFHEVILVKRALAEAIDAQRFTGIRWKELDKFS
jgi:hypothetical protein